VHVCRDCVLNVIQASLKPLVDPAWPIQARLKAAMYQVRAIVCARACDVTRQARVHMMLAADQEIEKKFGNQACFLLVSC
jgi:hypothetical protein